MSEVNNNQDLNKRKTMSNKVAGICFMISAVLFIALSVISSQLFYGIFGAVYIIVGCVFFYRHREEVKLHEKLKREYE